MKITAESMAKTKFCPYGVADGKCQVSECLAWQPVPRYTFYVEGYPTLKDYDEAHGYCRRLGYEKDKDKR